jgi:hypothetical protein
MRGWLNHTSAAMALFGGASGFFTPRLIAPWFVPAGGAGATSYYDTAKLRSTLERLVDFDRINSDSVRFIVGAVNVRSGNLVCFLIVLDPVIPRDFLQWDGIHYTAATHSKFAMTLAAQITGGQKREANQKRP